jgi:divinyl protochlorophyllide a 8-vinyl-reductase
MNTAVGRIGPNAILQCMAVLEATLGPERGHALMGRAGLGRHVAEPPQQMVDEHDVQALHRALRAELGTALARTLARAAGLATGDYLLAHRIPAPARALLPRLPASWASRLLLAAIARHAWTFCGSGEFRVLPRPHARAACVSLSASPTAAGTRAEEPLCDYFAATFERLYQSLVDPRARVVETECTAMGAASCVFEITW